ncbi:SusC/RagA family TonB-linked outer membrane protein [Sulfidibacter corallicola]|uniref:SusC/RagA family TonB-linked outer membrane protein n=1 Tax=Sulfidibacter corallicola TaxID=2818388 RepID=A0A8A4TY80_SULCO|nr:SusC/RagA family TonB-linked outer membrane protein [Sulfidibacter corallicola]QTD54044.1 SusC/RagA family TonB-linked outer membrane protein [Sulfidibacter corallicola]
MRLRVISLWAVVFLWVSPLLLAQNLSVTGTVTDGATGDPLPGATIVAVGTTYSTVSDGEGKFALTVPSSNEATIRVTFVGYQNFEQQISGPAANLDVQLKAEALNLSEEMVVTGFATSVKRANLANSVATISQEEISRVPVQTVDGALSGKFTGVTVRENSGAPGGGISVKLRGVSTINGSSQPLYVVDGVIVSNMAIQSGTNFVSEAASAGSSTPQDNPTNRIADLNPEDIESIEVLKGPSAAAIYGSKASNGVILITTKRGRAGETRYNFSAKFGQRSISNKLGQRVYTRDTAYSLGQAQGEFFDSVARADGTYELIDYEEEMYGNDGAIQEYNFSTSGGGDKTTFFISGSSLDDEGIIERTGYRKNGFRVNLDHRFSPTLRVSASTNFVKSTSDRGLTNNENRGGVTFGVALSSTPNFVDLRPDADGNYPNNPFAASNPLETRDKMLNRETVQRTVGSFKLDWEILSTATQTLDFSILAGYDFFSQENDSLFTPDLQFEEDKSNGLPGTTVQKTTDADNGNLYFNLTHTFIASSGTLFKTSGGLQFEETSSNERLIVGEGLFPNQANFDTAANISFVEQRQLEQRDRGFFIQEEITFGDAIYVVAGIRSDSSSNNGDEDKFYTFPKGAVSVRLSEYDFWEGVKDVFNEFKVRVAWGRTGNLPEFGRKYSSFETVNIDGSGGLLVGTTRGNPNIEPETSTELEIGFDAGIKDNMATFEVSYFNQDIDDLIMLQELPPSSGFQIEAINGGAMETEGIEAALAINPINTEEMEWTARLNYYTFESTITRLDVPAFTVAGGGFAPVLGEFFIEEGESATQIKGIENGEFIKLGDETPDFQLSWDNYFKYREWSLSWLLDWKEGGDAINLTFLLSDGAGTTHDLDTPEGAARAAAFGTTTSQLIEDAGYFKLRELRLQYELPRQRLKSMFNGRVSNIRLALTGRNLWTSTDYSSYDPEVSNFGNRSIGSIEVTPFPSSKSFYFTVSAGM